MQYGTCRQCHAYFVDCVRSTAAPDYCPHCHAPLVACRRDEVWTFLGGLAGQPLAESDLTDRGIARSLVPHPEV
jgi:hypothetical protein